MVGRGQRDAAWVKEVLEARDRRAAGETRPCSGIGLLEGHLLTCYNRAFQEKAACMFGGSTEKRVAREVERIVSLKEDLDARSWSRVLEIGRLLERADDEALAERGSELASIAQSNLSLRSRLGVGFQTSSAQMMASGMEVFEGGLAAAALDGARGEEAVADDDASEVATDARGEGSADAGAVTVEGAAGEEPSAMVEAEANEESDAAHIASAAVPEGEGPESWGQGEGVPPCSVSGSSFVQEAVRETVEGAADGGEGGRGSSEGSAKSRKASLPRAKASCPRPRRREPSASLASGICTRAATAACACSRTSTATSWPLTRRSSPTKKAPRRGLLSCCGLFGHGAVYEVDAVPHEEHVDDPDLCASGRRRPCARRAAAPARRC